MHYRADIDGLRAVAVVPVMLFHAGVPGLSGGFVGVDVFFVISGYLITSLITGELAQGNFSLAHFYERRVRRLLPALFTVIAASIPPALIILVPEHLEDFGQSVIAASVFVSNVFFYLEDGYFEGAAELHPLLHTWSLAVEEQFYLFFPLLLVLIRGKRLLPVWLVLLTLGSFGFGLWQLSTDSAGAFYLLPGRFWELLLGALLAVSGIGWSMNRFTATLLVTLGLLLIGIAAHLFNHRTVFPGSAALLPTVGAALVILGGRVANPLSSVLGSAPLRGIGLLSYSLYLWHFPLIVFARHLLVRPFNAVELAAFLTATFLLAWLTWRFIELPVRARPLRLQRKTLFRLVGSAAALCIAFGLFTDLSDGAAWRLPSAAQTLLLAKDDRDTGCMRRGENCDLGPADQPLRYIVWGDSHASALLPAFRHLSDASGITGRAALRGGCLPLIGYRLISVIAESCAQHVERTVQDIVQSDISRVFLAARWTMPVEESMYGFEAGQPLMFRDAVTPDPAESNLAVLTRAFEQTLSTLRSAEKQVVIIGPVPEVGWHVPHILAQRERFGAWLTRSAIAPAYSAFDARNQRTLQLLQTMASRHSARLLLPHQVLCNPATGCRITLQDRPLYFDGDHLTRTGALQLTPLLRPEFQHMLNQHQAATLEQPNQESGSQAAGSLHSQSGNYP